MLRLYFEELRDHFNSKYYVMAFITHRTSDVGVLQRLTDQVSPRTGDMRVLFAKDHLWRFNIILNVSCNFYLPTYNQLGSVWPTKRACLDLL